MPDDRSAHLAAVAALAEPTRRRLYEYVVRRPDATSRDEAAAGTGVPRATAAFHLDRLVAEGLLDVRYERRTGRTGPGAGRPAKLYRRADCSVAVSLPERRYDLAGHLLVDALAEAERSGEPPRAALERLAHLRGRALGEAARPPGEARAAREAVLSVLETHGFEPRVEDGGVALANCPFHALAREQAELVCGMNLRLLEGVIDGASASGLRARLRPGASACCVRLDAVEPP